MMWELIIIQVEQIALYWAIGLALGSVISVFGKQTMDVWVERLGKRRLGAFGVVPA